MKYEGNLIITKDNQINFKDLTEITGHLSVYSDAKLPKLETVGEDLNVYSNAKLDVPKLETIGEDLYINSDANLKAPKLETIGGHLNVSSNAKLDVPKLKENDVNAKYICEMNYNLALCRKGLIQADGILSWVLNEKALKDVSVFKVRIVGKSSTSFVVQKGEAFSHGETVEKAIEDLRYKVGNRDMSEFNSWKTNPDMKVSLDDAIAAYRVITGACSMGVKDFVESIQVPKVLTPKLIAKLTEGKYGNESFRKFLKG